MPTYVYRARNADGKLVKGTLQATSQDSASALLRSHFLTPLEVRSEDEARPIWQRTVFGRSVSTKDLILFSRQLASMINAGVPILAALRALGKQVTSDAARRLLDELAFAIEGGESLSSAMSKHPKVFSPFVLGVVRTGEASGRLSKSLISIADHLEQDYVFLRKVRAAMLYPAFVLVVVVILVIIMFAFVMPQLTSLFADAGVTLPWPTRVLIAVTNFVRAWWLVLLLVVAVLIALIRFYLRTPDGRYMASTAVLFLPLVSRLFQRIYLARLTSTLSTLFDSDVPVIESFGLAREAVGNRVYQRIMDGTAKAIKDGASISAVWEQESFIPPMLTTMVAVGERSGKMADAFAEANRYFKRDVDAILDSLAVLLEPILIIILGIGVGLVVASVILPIYNLVLVL